jgi:cell division initiation protein
MKITPLEIRQKSFEKKLRGYDKDEVSAFLLSLSQEWEQVQDEVKELRLKNQNAEKEIKQLREVENSLFKTLKTAEDTGANLIDQATKTAELHLRETQMSADALLNEAKSKARACIDEADDKARTILDGMQADLNELKQEYKHLQNLRDNLLVELRNLANDTLFKVEKIEKSLNVATQQTSPTMPVVEKEEVVPVSEKNDEDGGDDENALDRVLEYDQTDAEVEEEQKIDAEEDDSDEKGSFFDQIK